MIYLVSNKEITKSFDAAAPSSTLAVNSQQSTAHTWSHPKSFKNESEVMQVSLICKWIFGSDKTQDILSGKEKMRNITMQLTKMRFNGYLRLFELDMNIVKDFMTESSWTLFEDFKTKHHEDAWKCPICSMQFVQDSLKWKCGRCLFWYHEKCTKARETRQQDFENASLCSSCFFAL